MLHRQPTTPEEREAHERAVAAQTATKLQAAVEQAKTGKLPQKEQVTQTLKDAGEQIQRAAEHEKMGPEGAKAAKDLGEALKKGAKLVQEKPVAEKLETIVRETRLAQEAAAAKMPRGSLGEGAPSQEMVERAKHHANVLQQNVRPLLQLLATSGEFRSIVQELIELIRVWLMRGTETLTQKVQEGAEKVQQQVEKGAGKVQQQIEKGAEQIKQKADEATQPTGTETTGTSTSTSTGKGWSDIQATQKPSHSQTGGTSAVQQMEHESRRGELGVRQQQMSSAPSTTTASSSTRGSGGSGERWSERFHELQPTSSTSTSTPSSGSHGGAWRGQMGSSSTSQETSPSHSASTSTSTSTSQAHRPMQSTSSGTGLESGSRATSGSTFTSGGGGGGTQVETKMQQPMRDTQTETGVTQPSTTQLKADLDRLVDRAVVLLRKVSHTPNFRNGINSLSELVNIFVTYTRERATQAGQQVEKVTQAPAVKEHLEKSVQAAKELVESFTGQASLDGLLHEIKEFFNKLSSDSDLKDKLNEWWLRLKHTSAQALNQPDVLNSDEFRVRMRGMFDEAQQWVERLKHDEHLQRIPQEADRVMTAFQNDQVFNEFQCSMKKALDDIITRTSEGGISLNQNVLDQWKRVMVSTLENMRYIGVPRQEHHDETYDVVMDNIALAVKPILPGKVTISAGTQQHLAIRDWEYAGNRTALIIRIDNVHFDVREAKFALRRKSFPSIEDSGTVDFWTEGEGMHILMAFLQLQDPKEKRPHFHTVKTKSGAEGGVEVHINSLKAKVHDDANHPTLLNFVASVSSGRLRHELEKAIHDKLASISTSIVDQLNEYMRTM